MRIWNKLVYKFEKQYLKSYIKYKYKSKRFGKIEGLKSEKFKDLGRSSNKF